MRATLIFVVAALLGGRATAADLSFEGNWMRGDGRALVRIAPCGTKVCATNLWIGDTSRGEEAGDRLVMSLKPDASNTFSGTAYDPKRKLNYSIVLTVRERSLVTRGCFLGKILCKDVTWTAAR